MNQQHAEKQNQGPRAGRRGLLKATGIFAGATGLLGGGALSAAGATGSLSASLKRQTLPPWKPDPTFYPSPGAAMRAPVETLAYVVDVNPKDDGGADAIRVVDLDPQSPTYGQVLGGVEMPTAGDELHHFGWNACSSMLCPNAAHPHVER
ncbi:MAG TPA: selenium-binding protein SBP56-related protein, partial [Thermomicrobiales bacterium]|nr:selenium-binding protein SBP56-related protein [Thermomicrobiales bacterium]